jgi:hypothetical protein
MEKKGGAHMSLLVKLANQGRVNCRDKNFPARHHTLRQNAVLSFATMCACVNPPVTEVVLAKMVSLFSPK